MKKQKNFNKAVVFIIFCIPLFFNACKHKDGCWRCYETNIFYTQKICDEGYKNSLQYLGWTCW